MTFTEYETAVIQKLNECEQFKHWTFEDLLYFFHFLKDKKKLYPLIP